MMRTAATLLTLSTTLACVQTPADTETGSESLGASERGFSPDIPSSTSTGTDTADPSSSTGESGSSTSSEDTGSDDTGSDDMPLETGDTGEDPGEDPGGCPEDLITYVAPDDLFGATTESDLEPLVGVQCFEGSLWISDAIPSLANLESLEIVVGSITIGGVGNLSHLLTSLEGLENLTYVDGSIEINSPSLVSLAGLNALVEVEWGFTIRKANLQNVDPLAALTRVGAFQLGYPEGGGPWIEQIEGLSGLTEVGSLIIRKTAGLSSLAGLENLESAEWIVIVDNLDLVDVTPLGGGNAIPISYHLTIGDNPNLPTCNAWALADTLDVQGSVGVNNNLPDACGD